MTKRYKNNNNLRFTKDNLLITPGANDNSGFRQNRSFWLKVLASLIIILVLIGIFIPYRNSNRSRSPLGKTKHKNLEAQSYSDIFSEICEPSTAIENINIPRVLDMTPMTRGISFNEQNVGATSCAELNEILGLYGIEETYKEKYKGQHKKCDLANRYIDRFNNQHKNRLQSMLGNMRTRTYKLVDDFAETLNQKISYYTKHLSLSAAQNQEIAKGLETVKHLTQIYEVANYSYKHWAGQCGEHSRVAYVRIFAAQFQKRLPDQEIFHFVLDGTGLSHEFLLLIKYDIDSKTIPDKGNLYGLKAIKSFLDAQGDTICDSWNFFEMGGYRKISDLNKSRFYGFGKDPMQWPQARYERILRFEDLDKSKIPNELYADFQEIHEKLKQNILTLANKIESGRPNTATYDSSAEPVDESIANRQWQFT